MYLLIGLLGLAFLCSFWVGYKRLVQLQHLNKQRIINGFIAAIILLTLITLGQGSGFIPEETAARFTMFLYASVAGFFCGFAGKMVMLRQKMESAKYIYRSFWTEAAPNLIAILVITFGIYRTGLFTIGPYTGIGITSGLSLFGFGLFGLTLRIVPEFRRKGVLILDQFVPWKNIVSYRWESENVLQIDYYTIQNKLTDFTTYIPQDDQRQVEQLLGNKLKEHEQERRKMMSGVDEVS
jgi:uncharacterized membrane protein